MSMKINVHKTSLGSLDVYGACYPGENVDFVIVINSDCSDLTQTAAFLHECLHAWHDDFHDSRSVDEIEAERHAELIQILKLKTEEV